MKRIRIIYIDAAIAWVYSHAVRENFSHVPRVKLLSMPKEDLEQNMPSTKNGILRSL